MAETRSTTRPAGAQPAPTEGGAHPVEGNTTSTTTPNDQPGDTSSQDGDSDVDALDAESVPSTRYSTSLRQMMDSMYDDFKLNTGPDLENFEDLLKQFNHFMKFQASVMVACNFVYSRTDSSSISALGAEMLTKAIMQKLEVEADSEWEGWKRNLCEAARTKKELTQALWRVELTLPEALLAKLYAMYHPGIVAGDVVGTTTPKQYYEDLRKMPFHHVMHEILTPLIIIGTWKDVRILGGERIRQWIKDHPNNWWEIPEPAKDLLWIRTVDNKTNHTWVEKIFPTRTPGALRFREDDIPDPSTHPARIVDLNRMGQQNGNQNSQAGSGQGHTGRNNNRGGRRNNQGRSGGHGPRGQRKRDRDSPASEGTSGGGRKVARVADASTQCYQCRGYGHMARDCASTPVDGPKN